MNKTIVSIIALSSFAVACSDESDESSLESDESSLESDESSLESELLDAEPVAPADTTSEAAAPVPPLARYVHIKNRVSGLCLGVRGVDGHRPGTGVEVYHCRPGGADPGRDNQWKIQLLNTFLNTYYIRNRVSNLCLGVRGRDRHGPGTDVEVYHCNPGGGDRGHDNQWRISDGRWRFIANRVSALCLGVRGVDRHRPGTGAEVYRCYPGGGDPGKDNQWEIKTL